MSGVEILVAASLLTSAASTGYNMYSQNEAYKMRDKSIRLQQTALRIQETEADLDNMNNLEKVLARQTVMAGTRNIGQNSGSLAALTNETFNEFDRINDVNHLNFTTKQTALSEKSLANSLERRNKTIKAGLDFTQNALQTGMNYKSLLDFQEFAKRSSIAPQGVL